MTENREWINYIYQARCQICGWVGVESFSDRQVAQDDVAKHGRRAHPFVMKVLDRMEILDAIADAAIALAPSVDSLVHKSTEAFSPSVFCHGCGYTTEAVGHKDNCSVTALHRLAEALRQYDDTATY